MLLLYNIDTNQFTQLMLIDSVFYSACRLVSVYTTATTNSTNSQLSHRLIYISWQATSDKRVSCSRSCFEHAFSSVIDRERQRHTMSPVLYTLDASPPCRAVYMTAKATGTELEHKVVDLFKHEHFEPHYIKLNPKHSVPTFVDGDLILTDSHAITAYLVGNSGKIESLYPKAVAKRALVDQMMHFDSSLAFPSLLSIGIPLRLKVTKEISEDKVIKAHESYAFLEKYLDGKTWVSLDHPTIADIHLTATITSLDVFVPLENSYPHVSAWVDRCKQLEWYSENVKGLREFTEFFHMCLNA